MSPTTTSYDHTKPANVQRVRFAYEDDPTFQAFKNELKELFGRNPKCPMIKDYKLYGLWYVAKTFSKRWKTPPIGKNAEAIIFILGHFVSNFQSQIVMLAYFRHHDKDDLAWFDKWQDDVFVPTWARIQPNIQAAKDKKNARRRGKRVMKPKLKDRVLKTLQEHPMTTAILADLLEVSPKAIDGSLSRMIKTKEVSKLGRGLYSLPGADYHAKV
jgi:hypothetical protein